MPRLQRPAPAASAHQAARPPHSQELASLVEEGPATARVLSLMARAYAAAGAAPDRAAAAHAAAVARHPKDPELAVAMFGAHIRRGSWGWGGVGWMCISAYMGGFHWERREEEERALLARGHATRQLHTPPCRQSAEPAPPPQAAAHPPQGV